MEPKVTKHEIIRDSLKGRDKNEAIQEISLLASILHDCGDEESAFALKNVEEELNNR